MKRCRHSGTKSKQNGRLCNRRMPGQEAKEKQSLRVKARSKDEIFLRERPAHCRAITERLESFPVFAQSQTVLVYVSLPKEVDTHEIIERLIARGTKVLAPRATTEHTLVWSAIESLDELVMGKFGVLEPSPNSAMTPVPDDTVALVPGLAFDRFGYRLGWGAGYYDRFLSEFKGVSIGLTFDCQLYGLLPRESHDETVSYVITESAILNFTEK